MKCKVEMPIDRFYTYGIGKSSWSCIKCSREMSRAKNRREAAKAGRTPRVARRPTVNDEWVCTKCNKLLPRHKFRDDSRNKSRPRSRCIACNLAYDRMRYRKIGDEDYNKILKENKEWKRKKRRKVVRRRRGEYKWAFEYLKGNGISLAEMSRISGVSPSAIRRMITGETDSPSAETVQKMVNAAYEVMQEKTKNDSQGTKND